jgi:rsbT antagonist protein RsbS
MVIDVPVLKVEDYLLATVQSSLSDEDLVNFGRKLGREVGRQRVSGVIIDVSALDVIDSFAARQLRNIAESTRLRGVLTILVGIQPDVAYSLVRLGMILKGVEFALDLEGGLALMRNKVTNGSRLNCH